MNTVKVSKVKLLDTLKKNRETHKEQFEQAFKGYRKKMVETLQKNLDSFEKGGNVEVVVNVNLTRPQDHTEDYDRAIQMMTWEINDEIELTLQEFTQLVQDDWGWKQQFTTTNQFYGVKG